MQIMYNSIKRDCILLWRSVLTYYVGIRRPNKLQESKITNFSSIEFSLSISDIEFPAEEFSMHCTFHIM